MKKNVKNLFDLSGKVAIVTGAAGQLGSEFVRALLDAGAYVAAFDKWINNPKGRLKEIKSKKMIVMKVDVTDKDSIKDGLRTVLSKMGNPRILINNAAIDTPPDASGGLDTGPFETYPENSWQAIMDVNLKGVFLCCQVIGGHIAQTGGGSIINISSIYGMLSPDQEIYKYMSKPFYKPIAYTVSKSGIYNLTRYLATYWGKKKVRVNTVTFAGVFNKQDKRFINNYSKRVPLGRLARQDEYNGTIIFLASDASSYMTGSNVVIDGGLSSW